MSTYANDRGTAPVGAGVATAVGVTIVANLAWLVAASIAIIGGSRGAGSDTPVTGMLVMATILRTVAVLAVVLVGFGLAGRLVGRGAPAFWTVVAAVTYLLCLGTWGGNALFVATLLGGTDQGLVVRFAGFVLDGLVWVVVARAGVQWGLLRAGDLRTATRGLR